MNDSKAASRPFATIPTLLILALALPLASCMTVTISSDGESLRVIQHFGFLQIDVPVPQRSVVAQVSGLGLIGTPTGGSLGYTRQRFALLGPQCRAVLWFDGDTRLDLATRHLVEQIAGVCLVEDKPITNSQEK